MFSLRRVLAVGGFLAVAAIVTCSHVWGDPGPDKELKDFKAGNKAKTPESGRPLLRRGVRNDSALHRQAARRLQDDQGRNPVLRPPGRSRLVADMSGPAARLSRDGRHLRQQSGRLPGRRPKARRDAHRQDGRRRPPGLVDGQRRCPQPHEQGIQVQVAAGRRRQSAGEGIPFRRGQPQDGPEKSDR